MSRTVRIAVSFAFTVMAYGVYSVTAVPWIEPPAVASSSTDDLAGGFPASDTSDRVRELEPFFPADSWQLKTPKILGSENNQNRLIFQEYHNVGNGRIQLNRCSMILGPNESVTDAAERNRRSIVIDAPEGAILQFDKPPQLGRAEVGHLIGGKLLGPISIRSDGKSPGPEDDLRIVTSDVELTERHVWTAAPVDFRLGPNRGTGSEMHIYLAANDDSRSSGRMGPSVGGLESFELVHVERLHLEPQRKSAAGPAGPMMPFGSAPGGAMSLPAADAPVEITCRGPFRFNMAAMEATFQNQVDVMRNIPNGPSDQLTCELLTIFFAPKQPAPAATPGAKSPPGPKKPIGPTDLDPQRIRADGEPVVLTAPSQNVLASGQRLQYDLRTGCITLEAAQDAWLRQLTNEIHSRALQYQPATEPGRMGVVIARGPGWLRGQMKERPSQLQLQSPQLPAPQVPQQAQTPQAPQLLEAHWQDQMHIRPQGQCQLVSLTGGASLRFQEFGQLDAREIHFWLNEVPQPGTTKMELQPDRMLAENDVRIVSPQLDGNVAHLEVWFEHPQPGGPALEPPKRRFEPSTPPVAPPTAGASPLSREGRVQQTAAHFPATPAGASQQKFQVSGRLLRVRVLVPKQQPAEVLELMVQDDARFLEMQTARPDERPVLITGDYINATEPRSTHAVFLVVGRPAHFEGRGLELNGPNINLDRDANRLWVDGPGKMRLPLDRDFQGHPIARPEMLDIDWRRRMTFYGQVAIFEESVLATAPQGRVQTEELEVRFDRMIRFNDTAMLGQPAAPGAVQARPDVEQIFCRGGVQLETATFDPHGQPTAVEWLQATDLSLHRTTGDIHATGPGRLARVSRGSANTGMPALPGMTPATPVAAKNDNGLSSLNVRFQGPIVGNLLRREMTFNDQVRAARAPVEQWDAVIDPDRPERLGPNGVTMRCERLVVVEMPTPVDGRRNVEIQALGNAIVEATMYTARAARIAYAESKGLLLLEGDGWTDAELYRQQQVGGQADRLPAKRIYYWPQTNKVDVMGPRFMELNNMPGGPGAK